jgi:hypothetical protein
MPAPSAIPGPLQRQMTPPPVVLSPMERQMTPPPVVLPPMERQMTPPPVAIRRPVRPPAILNAPAGPLALELDTADLGAADHHGRAAQPPPAPPLAIDPPFRAPELPIEPLALPDEDPFEPPPPSLEPAPFSGRGGFDEDAIEEVEFFVSQGMYEDALAILAEQLERLPSHPLLLDRKREVEALAAGAPPDPLA